MEKYTIEFKVKIANEIINGKGYTEVESEYGVLRGTSYQWVKRLKTGKGFEDKRSNNNRKNYDETEFLKKSLALLNEIRFR